jgi:cytidine deaminase
MNFINHTDLDSPTFDQGMAETMIQAARTAATRAYCPHSDFHVGAALIMADDPDLTIYTGCNVENASFGATICAERNAITTAINDGHRRIGMLAIACPDSQDTDLSRRSPCGICRQVIGEFAGNDLILLLSRPDGDTDVITFGQLFPHGFRLT